MERKVSDRSSRQRVVAKRLADDLGVSVSTISRAFSPEAVIAPETRERVLKHAAEIGYKPNPYAQSLITRRSKIAGVIVSDIANPYYPEVLTGLTGALQEAGLNVMLFTGAAGETADKVLPLALHYQPDIVVVLAATLSFRAALESIEAGTNLIFFNRYVPDTPTHSVTCDNLRGGAEVADHLLSLGHRRLAYIAGPLDATTNSDRWEGYSSRCRERGVEQLQHEEAGAFSHDAGYAAASRLLASESPPQSIFCANDLLAMGALDAARRAFGLQVPRDLSIVGFDDISMAAWPSLALTTYRQPTRRMIATTIDLVRKVIADPDLKPVSKRVAGRLVVRETTGERGDEAKEHGHV
ncbi:MAG: LacI family DNA-binding transcriptional regulator [Rhodospirillales bacterium]